MKVVLRRAEAGDAGAIAALETECFSHPWSEKSVSELIANPDGRTVVACRGKKVVGYAGMLVSIDEGYITNVAVTEKLRRRGVGRLLVSGLAGAAREEKLRFITLELRQSNLSAAALYTGCGFEQVGLRRAYYDDPAEDAVLMTLYFK